MADQINVTPNERESAAGWVVALLIVLAIIVAAFLWFRNGAPGVPNTGTDSNTNVTVPVTTGGTDTGGSNGPAQAPTQ